MTERDVAWRDRLRYRFETTGLAINWLEDLSRPAVYDFLDHRKSVAGPAFEGPEAFISIVFLTGLMIFSANDQDVESASTLAYRFDSEVVIGIRCVPIKGSRHGA